MAGGTDATDAEAADADADAAILAEIYAEAESDAAASKCHGEQPGDVDEPEPDEPTAVYL